MQTFPAAPSASMLIESMRDIGYSLETALADVVDNAISANATQIEIFADTQNARIGSHRDVSIGVATRANSLRCGSVTKTWALGFLASSVPTNESNSLLFPLQPQAMPANA